MPHTARSHLRGTVPPANVLNGLNELNVLNEFICYQGAKLNVC